VGCGGRGLAGGGRKVPVRRRVRLGWRRPAGGIRSWEARPWGAAGTRPEYGPKTARSRRAGRSPCIGPLFGCRPRNWSRSGAKLRRNATGSAERTQKPPFRREKAAFHGLWRGRLQAEVRLPPGLPPLAARRSPLTARCLPRPPAPLYRTRGRPEGSGEFWRPKQLAPRRVPVRPWPARRPPLRQGPGGAGARNRPGRRKRPRPTR
jgi:hypothetical protein